MILTGKSLQVVVAIKPVDFRKGHDGLMAVVQSELGLDPHSGGIVVFRSKRADRIKILTWDGGGLVMAYKRLEQRGGSVCLNRSRSLYKWISALRVMPQPGLAAAR